MPRKKQKLASSSTSNNTQSPELALTAFKQVPNDVWHQIFWFTYKRHKGSLTALSAVSKKFHTIVTPKLWEYRLLDYIAKQGLDFIKREHVLEGLQNIDIKKLLVSIVELDRSLTMGNSEITYFHPISQETLDFLHEKHKINVVASYYYWCYATSQKNTTQGIIKIEQKDINESLNNIAEKNPAAYFLLAAHSIHPFIPSGNRFENFRKGLEKLGVVLTEENWLKIRKAISGWILLNRYFFRPLQFFRNKAELKFSNEKLNEILVDKPDRLFFIINILLHDGWIKTDENPLIITALTSSIYNANRAALEFLQGNLHYRATTLKLLSHPTFGDNFIDKLKSFQQNSRAKNPELAMFKLLDKIDKNSESLLILFDKHPNLINKYSLTALANMNDSQIDEIMLQCDPEYKKPTNILEMPFISFSEQKQDEKTEEIVQWYLQSFKPGFFSAGSEQSSDDSEPDEDSGSELDFS